MSRLLFMSLSVLTVSGCANLPKAVAQTSPPIVTARAQAPAVPPEDITALEKTIRDLLLKHLPDPIVESAPGWGKQRECTVGVKFHKDGLKLRSEPVTGLRNDGTWRRMSVKARNPQQSLAVAISEAAFPEAGKATFTAQIGVDCDLKLEQQIWKSGVRLFSGETRGRCHATVRVKCEITSRNDLAPGAVLPDVVFRIRLTDAQLFYNDLVIEHTAGIGGDAAKLLGQAVIATIKQVKPGLERDLLTRANAGIVKAADTREIRVSIETLLAGKIPASVRPR